MKISLFKTMEKNCPFWQDSPTTPQKMELKHNWTFFQHGFLYRERRSNIRFDPNAPKKWAKAANLLTVDFWKNNWNQRGFVCVIDHFATFLGWNQATVYNFMLLHHPSIEGSTENTQSSPIEPLASEIPFHFLNEHPWKPVHGNSAVLNTLLELCSANQ